MNKTTLNGFDRKEATIYSQNSVSKGSVVNITEDGLITKAKEGGQFIGLCTNKRGNYGSIVLRGYCEVPYSGTAPKCGFVNLSTTADNAVKIDDTNGRPIFVVGVDTVNKTIEIIL